MKYIGKITISTEEGGSLVEREMSQEEIVSEMGLKIIQLSVDNLDSRIGRLEDRVAITKKGKKERRKVQKHGKRVFQVKPCCHSKGPRHLKGCNGVAIPVNPDSIGGIEDAIGIPF